jgi:imidazolonepropionase
MRRKTMNLLFKGISEALTLTGAARKGAKRVTEADLSILKDAAIISKDGQIAWIGPQKRVSSKLIKELTGKKSIKEVDFKKRTVLPGFVEAHTHLVFAGNRAPEFEWRNQGVSYQEIAARGGGIRSTMAATRALSAAKLKVISQQRADRFARQGVTTLEIKSGYGLDLESEIKILKIAGQLEGPRIVRTFLGPHSLPPEFKSTAGYVDHLVGKVLPEVARKRLADRVDIFIEKGFFTLEDGKKWFAAAKRSSLDIVAHVDQLTAGGGAKLAAQAGAVSVDHCIHVSDEEIQLLAKSQTTAVLLPASDFYLRVQYPRARQLIDNGVRVALATDFNPGTSPTQDLSFVGVLARLEMKMTQAEVIAAYTIGAAHALNRDKLTGSLEVGKECDFAVIDGDFGELFYEVGHHPVCSTWRGGHPIAPIF